MDERRRPPIGKRQAVPERECGSQAIRCEPGSTARERVASFAVEPPRGGQLSLDVEPLAGRPCEVAWAAPQSSAQTRASSTTVAAAAAMS